MNSTLNNFDACWKRAPHCTNFVMREPEDGKAVTESTAVQVAYSEDALYIAMEMFDSEPGKIVSQLTRRDRDIDADAASVTIDSFHDHQTGYQFGVYASGTQYDMYMFDDANADMDWDAVWESGTKINDNSWTAEFKIPFECLRFAQAEDPVWGIMAARWVTRKQEESAWPYISEGESGLVSHFAHLTGVTNVRPSSRVEILPYTVGYEETEAEHPGNPDGRDSYGNAGVDVKYGISPNFTLNATINPDFGQVEVDQTVLNLTVFETFYPEKRPFFLEGANMFSTPFNLFYSRRIGKAPSLVPPDAADPIEWPGATTILGAAKITGKSAGGTSIAILEAATQRETAEYLDSHGVHKEGLVEPEANYLVARVKQDVGRNSSVGITATSASRHGYNPAHAGGVDWIMRFHNGGYASHGQVIGSLTGPDRRGWGGFMSLEKESGEHFHANISAQYLDKKVDINRLGFLSRNNVKEISSWSEWRERKDWWIVNEAYTAVYTDLNENLDGLKQNYGMDLDNTVQFKNFWSVSAGGWIDWGRTYFDWETRGGPPVPIPVGQSFDCNITSDQRKWWTVSTSYGTGDTWDGQFDIYRVTFNMRPRPNIEFSISPSYRTERNVSRWLTAVEDDEGNRQDIFGEHVLHQVDMTLRGTFLFTRDLSLQVFAQPFIAAADYDNFKRLVPPDSYEPVDASVYDPSVMKPDFNVKSFNSNLILRWEYMPGGTIYLVWTQARDNSQRGLGSLKLDRDLQTLFDTTGGNTFLVKASYRWAM